MLPNIPGQPESKMFVKNPVLTSYRHNFVIRQSKSVTIYGSIRYSKKSFGLNSFLVEASIMVDPKVIGEP